MQGLLIKASLPIRLTNHQTIVGQYFKLEIRLTTPEGKGNIIKKHLMSQASYKNVYFFPSVSRKPQILGRNHSGIGMKVRSACLRQSS